MNTGEKLISLFEENLGSYISGEEIADRLSVSRTAVWKKVNSLRKAGYTIEAVQNRGYRMLGISDVLSKEGITKFLREEYRNLILNVYDTVEGSTNDMVKEEARKGAPEGYAVISGAQTGGKGRAGRSFFSPKDTGVYLSLLLRPQKCSSEKALSITTIAAVAASEAIDDITDDRSSIKWVNDIYLNGRKVSGILTEASFDLETLYLDNAVLGIGFNVYPPKEGFPDDIKDRAGSILEHPLYDAKNRLAAGFINRFLDMYKDLDDRSYIEKYRDRSFVTGKKITVISGGVETDATAVAIDDECRLIVRYENGEEKALSSGEISIRI